LGAPEVGLRVELQIVRVLVVEDEVSLAEVVRRGLISDGFVVDVVHNGEDGLWAASESPTT